MRDCPTDMTVLVWDCKPERKEDPIHWVELKTSAEIRNDRDMLKYERKLLKFWAQSFLLGVPTIIVGFRDQYGIVHRLEELDTASIPGKVKKIGRGSWDGNICINFAAAFLDCMFIALSFPTQEANGYLPRAQADYSARWGLEDSETGEIPGH